MEKGTAADVEIYIRDAQGNILATYEMVGKELKLSSQTIYGSKRLGSYIPKTAVVQTATQGTKPSVWKTTVGDRNYELTEHRGNVLAVVSDLKLSTGYAKVKEAHDYYPFGMEMAGRVFKGDYKFGFQGQLEEDDIWGEGTASFFKYRLSDNRLGRFFAIDPLS
ncbi:MAG: hypothetical protein RIS47_324, partial [Bacteroidota bacterium]